MIVCAEPAALKRPGRNDEGQRAGVYARQGSIPGLRDLGHDTPMANAQKTPDMICAAIETIGTISAWRTS